MRDGIRDYSEGKDMKRCIPSDAEEQEGFVGQDVR